MTRIASTAAERARPRVEGEREQEILGAALHVLADVGYDRLTMDAVAAQAKASKATLYRRWNGKADLVIDALVSMKEPTTTPDTGSLRGDLLGMFCGMGGLTDTHLTSILGSVLTAIGRDQDFADAFRRHFISPKYDAGLAIFERARARGEISADVDLDILVPALPGIVLHRLFFLGQVPTNDVITRIIDQVIIPAATRG
jgi:AcrR family transcriptional regulator